MKQITVETTIKDVPVQKVWEYWTEPRHIVQWAFASDDWEAPEAENDVREGGTFRTVMAAKDGSASFDFTGTYTKVEQYKTIDYVMDGDGRQVHVEFEDTPLGVTIVQTFDPENENPEDIQRAGWQAILDNFKAHVESSSK